MRNVRQDVGVPVLAQEHGEATISAQIEGEENIFVPENIDAGATQSECWIN